MLRQMARRSRYCRDVYWAAGAWPDAAENDGGNASPTVDLFQ
jgi:hypothetical protein